MLPQGATVYPYAEVRFKGSRKEFFKYNPQELELFTGDWVVCEGKSGFDVGRISLKGELVRLQMLKKKVKETSEDVRQITKKAGDEDLDKLKEFRAKEPELLTRTRAIIQTEGLDMKLSDLEFQGDGSKVFFFYTAEDRVDFRNLIRVLANEFKVRVEMRQIGARQEAAVLGGIGICGRELCCSTWLSDFKSVPTSAARYQNLSLNPVKLAGQCGRLKCCLNYELDTYLDALKAFPEKADYLYTHAGKAELFKTDVFKQIMWYVYKEGSNHTPYPVDVETVKEILAMNANQQKPESLESMAIQEEELVPNEDFLDDVTSDMSLNRFDRSKKKKKKKPQNNQRQGTPNNSGEGNQQNQRPRNEAQAQNRNQPRPPRAEGQSPAGSGERRPNPNQNRSNNENGGNRGPQNTNQNGERRPNPNQNRNNGENGGNRGPQNPNPRNEPRPAPTAADGQNPTSRPEGGNGNSSENPNAGKKNFRRNNRNRPPRNPSYPNSGGES
jgi:cell fate regulator YaaT (PSP1 superfamily)